MKIFKLFLLLFVAAVATCNLTACKDKDKDDDKNNSSNPSAIVGTWEDKGEHGYDRITFNEDGSFTWVFVDYDYGTDTEYGTYNYNGRNLALHFSDGDTDIYDVTVSGNEMIWYVEGESCVYTRL